ncbi:hypothetical protein ACG83_40740 [Frankia sp. R43]|nr:hypothetical protein ACG83_40740 [Frankia sp. R43]
MTMDRRMTSGHSVVATTEELVTAHLAEDQVLAGPEVVRVVVDPLCGATAMPVRVRRSRALECAPMPTAQRPASLSLDTLRPRPVQASFLLAYRFDQDGYIRWNGHLRGPQCRMTASFSVSADFDAPRPHRHPQ